MQQGQDQPWDATELRRRANEQLKRQAAESGEPRTEIETARLVHELEVHQIELKLQNEELRQTQVKLETLLAQYTDLYDFAPVGYFTLNHQGLILKANLVAGTLLGMQRGALVQRPLTHFILSEDQNLYFGRRAQFLETGQSWMCELRLVRRDGSWFWAQLDAVEARDDANGAPLCRVTMCDITERKQAELETQTLQTAAQDRDRLKLVSQQIIASREAERKRVSSALHHDVGSLAVGMSAHLDAIEQELRAGKVAESLKWMKRTRKLFAESVLHLKEVAVQLRPPELDVFGLRATLRQHFAQVTKHTGICIQFKENWGRRQVPGDTVTILFRVAQEALTNAITHGHAKQVDVDLRASNKAVSLTVHDNGQGFDPSAGKTRETMQLGLCVMQEMATSAGGDLTIDSTPGTGTTLCLNLPLGV